MLYEFIKPLHVIFMTFWMAGVFFLGRMIIYYVDAKKEPENIRSNIQAYFTKAQTRIWNIIILPSMTLTISAGFYLAYILKLFSQGWFHFKLLMVFLLVAHTIHLRVLGVRVKCRSVSSSKLLRLYNEVPALLLVMIVFAIYFRSIVTTLSGTLIFFGVVLSLVMLILKLINRK
ncbi:hypothetical protein DID75_03535 [Candidatus Marinamargulisbacteria bacterium SCGC AG-410-N11]|nr:hypothetical protein DID75_03535 [Candidatus Marinamargulisbacteria bacterium SCGC AG-410-N11]